MQARVTQSRKALLVLHGIAIAGTIVLGTTALLFKTNILQSKEAFIIGVGMPSFALMLDVLLPCWIVYWYGRRVAFIIGVGMLFFTPSFAAIRIFDVLSTLPLYIHRKYRKLLRTLWKLIKLVCGICDIFRIVGAGIGLYMAFAPLGSLMYDRLLAASGTQGEGLFGCVCGCVWLCRCAVVRSRGCVCDRMCVCVCVCV